MKNYLVSAGHRQTIEYFEYRHKDDCDKSFTLEVGWRWGTYNVQLEDAEFEILNNADEDIDDSDLEFHPFDYQAEEVKLDDCSWTSWSYQNIDTEEQKQIEARYEEDIVDGLNELGYELESYDLVLRGPLEIEPVEDK